MITLACSAVIGSNSFSKLVLNRKENLNFALFAEFTFCVSKWVSESVCVCASESKSICGVYESENWKGEKKQKNLG